MVEMRRIMPRGGGPRGGGLNQAGLWEDGQDLGHARWEYQPLTWPGETVQVARVAEFQAPDNLRSDFWAYLCFLFQTDRAAAAELVGVMFWFSETLRKSWEDRTAI